MPKRIKILYGIQGTGNGHLSRAISLHPELIKHFDVDFLLSGSEHRLQPDLPIKFHVHGLCFVFGKNGGIDYLSTLKKLRPIQFFRTIYSLPLDEYDFIISDFEPVTAWAARIRKKKSVAMSHQVAVIADKSPKPETATAGAYLRFMRLYAPCKRRLGFHFQSYEDWILPPIIKPQLDLSKVQDEHFYLIYLPAYSDEFLIQQLNPYRNHRFVIFSNKTLSSSEHGHIQIFPAHNQAFTEYLHRCTGLITGGGFETPAEALFLRKKLIVIPMHDQYEQLCNAEALQQMGVPVMKSFDLHANQTIFQSWLDDAFPIPEVNYSQDIQPTIDKLKEIFESF